MTERSQPNSAAINAIVEGLPTFADCYVQPRRINLPSRGRLERVALDIVDRLHRAGYEICPMENQS